MLPSRIGPLQETNSPGACRLQFLPADQVASMPAEVRGTVPSEIVAVDGAVWITVIPTQFTQDFRESWEMRDGDQFASAKLGFLLPKDRPELLHGLYALKTGRYVVLHHDRNGTVKVMGTKAEPAMVRVRELQHGADPRRNGNRYTVEVSVTRRMECPFYLASPPVPQSSDCPSLAQQIAAASAETIAGLLSTEQTTALQAILCTECPDLAALVTLATPSQLLAVMSQEQIDHVINEHGTSLCDMLDEAIGQDVVPGLLVSGAGYGPANGEWDEDGTQNGRTRYVKDTLECYWSGTQWFVTDSIDGYYSNEDVVEPWLVVTWLTDLGWDAPAPSVTQRMAGDASAVLDCLDSEQRTLLLSGMLSGMEWDEIAALLDSEQTADASGGVRINSTPVTLVPPADVVNILVKDGTGAQVGSLVGEEWIVPTRPADGDALVHMRNRLMWSGQNTVYAAGDEGTMLAQGWFDPSWTLGPNTVLQGLVNIYTLAHNNQFGNTSRFTNPSGGSPDTTGDRIILDHALRLKFLRYDSLPTSNWATAIAASVAETTDGGGWLMPNDKIMDSITDDNLTSPLNHSGFLVTVNLWTGTTRPDDTSIARIFNSGGGGIIGNNNKVSSSNGYLLCKPF